ncbi:MAG: UMP kinase [Alphaproteobacteria bacterium]|nr:UMP kinase [Alphaproteobacteria bacterium]
MGASRGTRAKTVALPPGPYYRRVLVKLSGEAFAGPQGYGIDGEKVSHIAREVRSVYRLGVQVCIVIGAGNIFRGAESKLQYLDRPTADEMGMLATVINGLALHSALRAQNIKAHVMSAISMPEICQPFVRWQAHAYLEQSEVLVCAAGTGSPLFTTDTAAAVRAAELRCDAIFKGTQVDGIYDSDPHRNPNARRFPWISYQHALAKNLKVMDSAALSIARDAKIPILVFSLEGTNALVDAVQGQGTFTMVSDEPRHLVLHDRRVGEKAFGMMGAEEG